MPDRDFTQDPARHELDPELLRTLAQQKGVEVGQSRKHTRIEVELKVVVRPANASEHARFRLQGISADLSRGGCRLILPLPVGVGDVFRLEFASAAQPIAPVFARCLRCRLVREQVFEAGFQFLTAIELPQLDTGEPGE
jgi:c-di-GMP-binding flagellar brake protein YcgR